jgi:hypothetical protein
MKERQNPLRKTERIIMNAVKCLSTAAVAALALAMNLSARGSEQPVASASKELTLRGATTTKWQYITVQAGRGGTTSFVIPAVQQTSREKSVAAREQHSTHWMQVSVPNGMSVSYSVPNQQHFELAPLK